MPYIEFKERREQLRMGDIALNAAELNYQIFYYVKYQEKNHTSQDFTNKIKLCVDQFLGENPNYQKYNDMTGCLIRCYKELDRRLNIPYSILQILKNIMESYDGEIARYEDLKIQQNGDVE